MLDTRDILSSNAVPMRGKTPNPKNRRVQRTDQRLRAAFIALMREQGHDAITINAVARRAGVGRSTFYTHFGDLEELHEQWFKEFTGRAPGERQVFGFTRSFFEHAYEQRPIWSAQHHKPRGATMQKRLRKNILARVREDVTRIATNSSPAAQESVARYIAGAFTELLFWWIDSPTPLTPAQIDAAFHRLTGGALSALYLPREIARAQH